MAADTVTGSPPHTRGAVGPYKVDRVAPTGEITLTPPDNDWVYDISVKGADEHSGVQKIHYLWVQSASPIQEWPDNWQSWPVKMASAARILPPQSGENWHLFAVIVDKAGNYIFRYASSLKVDMEPPSVDSIVPTEETLPDQYRYNAVLKVKASAPGPSGLKEIRWYWQNGFEPVPPYSEWTCIDPRDIPPGDDIKSGVNVPGEWRLHVAAINGALNVAYGVSERYVLYEDKITIILNPDEWPQFTRAQIKTEVIIHRHDRKENENPDPGDMTSWTLPMIYTFQEVFENGTVSLKNYIETPGLVTQLINMPSNGEWHLGVFVKALTNNIYSAAGGPYRRDTIPPHITGEDTYYDPLKHKYELTIDISNYPIYKDESYLVLKMERQYNENWEPEDYCLIKGPDGGTFWAKASEVPAGVGGRFHVGGRSKQSPYSHAECCWSQSPSPPGTGWEACPQTYTTTKVIAEGESWYHHVRAWDEAGNMGAETFGPYTRYGGSNPGQKPLPTARINGPATAKVGEATHYTYSGTVSLNPGRFNLVECYGGNTYNQGSFNSSFSQGINITFPRPGWYMLRIAVYDNEERSAWDTLSVYVTENGPTPEAFLTASLMPYIVRHGDTLSVYATSSEPNPWVQVWGQRINMSFVEPYWEAHFPVNPSWPLGSNYLTVNNGLKQVVLDFIIIEDNNPPAQKPTASVTGKVKVNVGDANPYKFTGTAQGAASYTISETFDNEVLQSGIFNLTLDRTLNLSFEEAGWYNLHISVQDELGQKATDSLLIEAVDINPPDDHHLSAFLMPYFVRHGDTLSVYATSSEPNPWVQVWGQRYNMSFVTPYWEANIVVPDSWPLGGNNLTVNNNFKQVILEFFIVEELPPEPPEAPKPPRTRIIF